MNYRPPNLQIPELHPDLLLLMLLLLLMVLMLLMLLMLLLMLGDSLSTQQQAGEAALMKLCFHPCPHL